MLTSLRGDSKDNVNTFEETQIHRYGVNKPRAIMQKLNQSTMGPLGIFSVYRLWQLSLCWLVITGPSQDPKPITFGDSNPEGKNQSSDYANIEVFKHWTNNWAHYLLHVHWVRKTENRVWCMAGFPCNYIIKGALKRKVSEYKSSFQKYFFKWFGKPFPQTLKTLLTIPA